MSLMELEMLQKAKSEKKKMVKPKKSKLINIDIEHLDIDSIL